MLRALAIALGWGGLAASGALAGIVIVKPQWANYTTAGAALYVKRFGWLAGIISGKVLFRAAERIDPEPKSPWD